MNVSRESVFQALFTLVSGALIGGQPAFVTTSRRLQQWSNVAPAQQPALFVMEGNQSAGESGPYGLTRWELRAHLFIYARVGADPEETPSTTLNNLVDAVEWAILNVPKGQAQTLGGLVSDCRIVGEVVIDEGVLDQQALAIVPVSIITGI